MIVKNEAGVIRRCLHSAKDLISHWVISDTGSTDGTREIIRESLNGIPGALYEDDWVHFGHNRTLAIQRAKGKADYHLLLNADETINVKDEFRHKLTDDYYLVRFTGELDYHFPALVSDQHDWKYKGHTHEHIDSPTAKARSKLPEVSLTHHFDGGNRAVRLDRELTLLSQALKEEPENSRHIFYLAQTLREMGRTEEAIDWYVKRVAVGGWEEEVFYSLYKIAQLQHGLGRLTWPQVLDSYLRAYQYRPSRLEPLLNVARFYRESRQYELGYLFSRPVVEMPYPDDVLFIERNIYEYELPLEYAICCYWLGKHDEAIRVNDQIITCPNTPPNFLEAAKRNRQFSHEALSGADRNCDGVSEDPLRLA